MDDILRPVPTWLLSPEISIMLAEDSLLTKFSVPTFCLFAARGSSDGLVELFSWRSKTFFWFGRGRIDGLLSLFFKLLTGLNDPGMLAYKCISCVLLKMTGLLSTFFSPAIILFLPGANATAAWRAGGLDRQSVSGFLGLGPLK